MSDKKSNQRGTWDQFGDAYDWPRFDGKIRGYVLASSGRTGSHLLAHMLFKSGRFGSPLEYLHPKHLARWEKEFSCEGPADVLRALMARRTGPTGLFGVKAHWKQFQTLLNAPVEPAALGFETYIRLARRDKVLQAVSMAIAQMSGSWISHHGPGLPIQYNFDVVDKAHRAILDEDRCWADYFVHHRISPLEIYYEDLNEAPNLVLERVATYLGDELSPGTRYFEGAPEKQGSQANLEWAERYRREALLR